MDKKKVMILCILGGLLGLLTLFAYIYSNNFVDTPENPNPNNPSSDTPINPGIPTEPSDYLIIENKEIWRLRNNNWRDIDFDDIEEIDELKNKFKVYIDGNYQDNYYLKYVKNWNLFNDNNEYINYTGKLVAITSDMNINIRNFNITPISNEELITVNNIMQNNITYESLSVNEEIIMDLDQNGINDRIISVSNLDSIEQPIYFNLVYVILNNDNPIILLKDNVDENETLEAPIYNISYIMNINNEAKDSIILQEGYFSDNGETGYLLYQFKNNSYQKVIDND